MEGKGSIFIDYRCENPFSDFNTILYGIACGMAVCSILLQSIGDRDYYEKHRKMMLITPEKKYDLYIFGVVTVASDSDRYKYSFESAEKSRST